MEKEIDITLPEAMKLKKIQIKHKLLDLEKMDFTLSLMKKIRDLDIQKSTNEEIEEIQTQLRAMLNKTEQDLRDLKDDEEFVKEIAYRFEGD